MAAFKISADMVGKLSHTFHSTADSSLVIVDTEGKEHTVEVIKVDMVYITAIKVDGEVVWACCGVDGRWASLPDFGDPCTNCLPYEVVR